MDKLIVGVIVTFICLIGGIVIMFLSPSIQNLCLMIIEASSFVLCFTFYKLNNSNKNKKE